MIPEMPVGLLDSELLLKRKAPELEISCASPSLHNTFCTFSQTHRGKDRYVQPLSSHPLKKQVLNLPNRLKFSLDNFYPPFRFLILKGTLKICYYVAL